MVELRASFLLLISLAFSLLASATTSNHHSPATPRAASSSIINNEPHFTHEELYKLLTNFWDNFLYPADVTQAKSINSTIFSENVQGRIDVTRTFDGRELNTEYLFGLFANLAATPQSISLIGVPISYEILKFSGNDYLSSASTRLMFNLTSLDLVVPVEIDTWTAWNSLGQMTQYDGIFKYWQWLQDFVIESAMPVLNATTTTQAVEILTEVLAQEICVTALTYCNGTNTQYTDLPSCYEFLTQDVRFGEAYEFGRNTLVCRMLHQNMVPFRPSVHCPHIGPTGGGYCTDDTTYVGTVEETYFNISWIPFPG